MLPLITVLTTHFRCTTEQLRKILKVPLIRKKAENFIFLNFNAYNTSNPEKKFRIYVCDHTRRPESVGKVPVFNMMHVPELMFNTRYFTEYKIVLRENDIMCAYQNQRCMASANHAFEDVVLELVPKYAEPMAYMQYFWVIQDEIAKWDTPEGSQVPKEVLIELMDKYGNEDISNRWKKVLPPPEPEDDLADNFTKLSLKPLEKSKRHQCLKCLAEGENVYHAES